MTSPARRGAAALLAALALAPLARAQARPDRDATPVTVQLSPGTSEVDAVDLVRAGAQAVGGVVVEDPQLAPVRVRVFSTGPAGEPVALTWGAVKALLDFHDVVVVESRPTPGGPFVVRAHHRRNLAQREGPPWRIVAPGEVPPWDELVTALVPIRHGAGQAIFATVRGLLTRDANRIGNVLYIPGAEVLVVVDLASRVAYYADLAARLDVPPPPPVGTRAFRLRHADPHAVAAALQTLLGPTPGVPGGPSSPSAPSVRVAADPRGRQVTVSGALAELAEAERVVAALDVEAPATDPSVLRVYAVEGEDGRAAASYLRQAMDALARVGATRALVQVLDGPRPKTVAVVARPEDLPRVEEALATLRAQ